MHVAYASLSNTAQLAWHGIYDSRKVQTKYASDSYDLEIYGASFDILRISSRAASGIKHTWVTKTQSTTVSGMASASSIQEYRRWTDPSAQQPLSYNDREKAYNNLPIWQSSTAAVLADGSLTCGKTLLVLFECYISSHPASSVGILELEIYVMVHWHSGIRIWEDGVLRLIILVA